MLNDIKKVDIIKHKKLTHKFTCIKIEIVASG